MRSSVSIALFFLLSAFFLFALLAALQHSKKALAIAVVCLAGLICIIVFLTPVRLPRWLPLRGKTTTTSTVTAATTTTLPGATTTGSAPPSATTGASGPPGGTTTTVMSSTTSGAVPGTTTTVSGR